MPPCLIVHVFRRCRHADLLQACASYKGPSHDRLFSAGDVMDSYLGQACAATERVVPYRRHASGQVERCKAAAVLERVFADRRQVLGEADLYYARAVLERVGADFCNYRAFDSCRNNDDLLIS